MSEAHSKRILLVGVGRMGSALLKGWLDRGIDARHVQVQEPQPSQEIAEWLKGAGVEFSGAGSETGAPAVIVLAVKPQVMDDVVAQLVPLAGPDTVVLSIAAGRTIGSLARHFGSGAAIVRAMPNTPASIGKGISALYANGNVTPEQAKECEELMSAAGETVWLDDEALMDAVTAVSGSGPAYVFLLAECLAQAGEKAGLPAELAVKLARATVSGASDLMRHSGEPAAQLRRNVTSPGGTTEAALRVLMGDSEASDGPLADLISEAVAAAAKRSGELAG